VRLRRTCWGLGMQSEWEEVKLSEIAEINMGQSPASSSYNDSGEGEIFYQGNRDFGSLYPAVSVHTTEPKKIASSRDVLMSVRAPVGELNIANQRCCIGRGLAAIRLKDNHSRFLYYLLKHSMNKLHQVSTGTTFSSINKTDLTNLEVLIPSLPTQKKIAHILSTLDDKIELNRKMNQTLEEMAQALFKSWFVDFDPVHAKARCGSDAELEKAATALGISQEILELFPREFEESEMGMIPKGWEVSTIGNEFTVTMGQSPAGKSYNETKNGMIFFQGRRDFGTYFPSERVYTTEPKRLAKEDDILLSVRAPVGDINIAMKACCIGRGLSALKHKSDSISYSYLVVKNLRVYFDGFNTEGTVFGSVNQNTLKSLNVLNDEEIIQKFNDVAEPMFQQIKNNSIEILSLEKIRDTLLPKLLSGELDVSNMKVTNGQ